MKTSGLILSCGALALVATLSASQTLAADMMPESGWHQVSYRCESGQLLSVAYRDSGSAAEVTTADKPPVKLMSRPAKAGFRYGDSRSELRGDGDAVTWQIGSKSPLKCTSGNPAPTNLAAEAR